MQSFEVINDDLDFGTIPTSASTTPAAVVAAPTYEQIDWDDAKVDSYSDGLDRIKSPKGEVSRFSLLTAIPKVSGLAHWVGEGKSLRMYRCCGAGCTLCSTNETKKIHAGMAVQYMNADKLTGKLEPKTKPEYRVGFVSPSPSNLKELLEAPLEGVKPSQVDYVMTYDGRRYGFRVVGHPAVHILRRETAELVALAQPLAHLLSKKLGSLPPANGSQNDQFGDF